MRIGFNAPSMQAYNALARSDKAMISSSTKLSSGTKITSSADNSAGLAISNNMKLQIDALSRAEKNASNGISLLQTAEGGLGEIQSMLQRMRELGIQAANDTNTDDDRGLIQIEIEQLMNEIIDMTKKTEYNQTKLLKGGEQGDLELIFHTGEHKNYNMRIELPEISCKTLGLFTKTTYPSAYVEYRKYTDAYEKIANEHDRLATEFQNATHELELAESRRDHLTQERADADAALADAEAQYGKDSDEYESALARLITIDKALAEYSDPTSDVAIALQDAVTAHAAAEAAYITAQIPEAYEAATKQYKLDIRDKVPLDAVENPDYLISRVDEAIEKISSYRAHIGAFVNRLEHTSSYLLSSHTEASSSLSRIYDTDVALEMANYSRLQVLTQTATSIMSQANQMPQSVLQLLQ